jgi:hypothetical protein
MKILTMVPTIIIAIAAVAACTNASRLTALADTSGQGGCSPELGSHGGSGFGGNGLHNTQSPADTGGFGCGGTPPDQGGTRTGGSGGGGVTICDPTSCTGHGNIGGHVEP